MVENWRKDNVFIAGKETAHEKTTDSPWYCFV